MMVSSLLAGATGKAASTTGSSTNRGINGSIASTSAAGVTVATDAEGAGGCGVSISATTAGAAVAVEAAGGVGCSPSTMIIFSSSGAAFLKGVILVVSLCSNPVAISVIPSLSPNRSS